MPLPKSITSLLTAIVVAIPAAITTLALNKPKPPKEIDAVIQLDENKEVIDEKEIKPTPKPAPPSTPPESPHSSSGISLPGVGQSSDGASFSTNSETDNGSEITEDEDEEDGSGTEDDVDEPGVEEEIEEQPETKDNSDEQTDEEKDEEPKDNDQVSASEDSQKDPTLEELQNSIKEIMQKIIDEGKSFNSKDSSLYSLYTIKTGLETLPGLLASLKTKMDEEKNKAASVSAGAGSPPAAQPGGEQS